MQEFTYEQIRAKALKEGIKDNHVAIGTWAKFKGYMKRKKQSKRNISIIYIAPMRLNY